MNTNDSISSQQSLPPTTGFSEGQKLAGCYELKQHLAAAGGAEVWLAHDEVLGKDVSLHFVPEIVLNDAGAMGDLRQEVKRNRQLIHPNILRVYDLVEESGWAAISMDAFDGESLAVRFGKKGGAGFDPAEIHPWIAQLFQTLGDTHKINVLHRDLLLENLVLTDDGKLLVANFGISRCLADAVVRISGKKNPRIAAQSPQQVDGAPATGADDIYAVATLLFQSLTGRFPFEGDDLAGQIRKAPAPSISSLRDPAAPAVPAAWEKAIAACLEKNPESRPRNLQEMAKHFTGAESEQAAKLGPDRKVEIEVKKAVEPAVDEEKKSPLESTPAIAEALPKPSLKPASAPFKPAESASPFLKKPSLDVYANATTESSRVPRVGLAIAAGLILVGALGYGLTGAGKDSKNSEPTAGLTPTDPPEGLELRPVSNTTAPAPAEPERAVQISDEVPKPDLGKSVADIAAKTFIPPGTGAMLLAAAATPPPVAAQAKPGAAPSSPAPGVSPSALSDEEKAVVEKTSALEKAKQAAQATEKAREDLAKQQRQAEMAVTEAQKALDQKTKALGPVKKAAQDVMAQRKKLEEEQAAADLAAEQARQLAAEKVRVAEVAKKAIADLENKNKDKFAAQEKADSEMQILQKAVADKQQAVEAMAKSATEVEANRLSQIAAMKRSEQEVEQAKTVAVEAKRLREEAEAERRKLGQELMEMQKMMEKKKAEIEDRLKKLESPGTKPAAVVPVPSPDVKPVEKPAPVIPAIKPASAANPAPMAPMPATPAPLAVLPPVSVLPAATPVPSAPPQLAMKTEPEKIVVAPKVAVPAIGAENSLGMKFVPVGDVDFSIWQTRVKDFEVFAKAVNLKSSAWRGPGFKQGPDHPVVNVSWVEAIAFCKWLTELEHKDGTLPAAQFYRLPTDLEWSKAVGLSDESGKTPEARDMGVSDVFPWGTQWPPPPNSGNYTGEETGSDVAIKGYDDGFAWTSPVGSFPPNKLGLYDMGGNVWQWCMDAWNTDSKAKVLRGASWYNGALKLSLLSSCRVHASPDSSTDNYGFRIVRVSDSVKAGKR